MNTHCGGCVFEKPYFDCKLGKLQKLELAGAKIERNSETGSAVIQGRLCGFCRNVASEWAKHVPQEDWESRIKSDNDVRMLLICELDDNENENRIVTNLLCLTKQPSEVVFLVHEKYGAAELYQRLNAQDLPFRWSVSMWIDDSIFHPVDVILNRVTPEIANFYTIVPDGYVLPENYIEVIDKALNEEMLPFVQVNYINARTYAVAVHHSLGGFREMTTEDGVVFANLSDKTKYVTNLDNTPELIKDYKELWNALCLA